MAKFRQREIARAIRGLQAAGLDVAGVKVSPDGSFEVITGVLSKPEVQDTCNEWDTLNGNASIEARQQLP
jgi:hypothetical protein